MTPDVVIIGGGLAGLSCANTLTQQGITNNILEAADEVGGRARTDRLDGFLLDRGFQVFSTAYPEAKRILKYDALKLHTFYPGALVRFDGQFHRIADPYRHPLHALQSVLNPIGTMKDKVRVATWRHQVLKDPLQELLSRPETSTIDHLQSMGFSQSIINRFFRPFLGGVFMDQELTTSSRMADFVFRMFASGDSALPEEGMGALAQQLAHNLQSEQIQLRKKVVKVQGTTVTLESGETLPARRVVIATERSAATQLAPEVPPHLFRGTTCLYFHAPEPPLNGPHLILNGETRGVINSLYLPTEVTRSYAPPGQHLISITTNENSLSDKMTIKEAVQNHLIEWFGTQVHTWQHIKTYFIQSAQSVQTPPFYPGTIASSKIRDGLYICGDHRSTATIDGAIGSGRRTAEEIASEIMN
ncbi:NAD(P)/FAD-dependent oxidoreductase [Candidatus Nitrospira salsa]